MASCVPFLLLLRLPMMKNRRTSTLNNLNCAFSHFTDFTTLDYKVFWCEWNAAKAELAWGKESRGQAMPACVKGGSGEVCLQGNHIADGVQQFASWGHRSEVTVKMLPVNGRVGSWPNVQSFNLHTQTQTGLAIPHMQDLRSTQWQCVCV